MSNRLKWSVVLLGLGLCLMSGGTPAHAAPGEATFEATLIWGTNDETTDDPSLKPVNERIARKLKGLPFKWKRYYEVNRKRFQAASEKPVAVTMSKDCEIRVRALSRKQQVELSLYGQGNRVGTITQALPKGEMLVTGGNADNFTSWFVVLTRAE